MSSADRRATGKAYAKINLFLDITGRLPNGYHTLNTVMRQIDLYDTVTVTLSDGAGISLSCTDPAVPQNEKNIAYCAAEAFFRETGFSARTAIHIEKKIPLEAGLGGSSTDGAAVLSALNRLFGAPIPEPRLFEIGAMLGADVPFCLFGGTAVCGGIGEKMTRAASSDDYVIGLVKPSFSCSTAAAYRAYDEAPIPAREDDFAAFVRALPKGKSAWSGGVYNVFEQLYQDRRIAALTEALTENGACAAMLSGSGSAVFGIFSDRAAADAALEKIDAPFKACVRPI